jgi:hypothetical protein
MAREDELRPIEGFGGPSASKGPGEASSLSFKDAQPAAKAPAAKPIETSDKIEISEELKEYGSSDGTKKEIDALKKQLQELGGAAGLQPSPKRDYQGILEGDLQALKNEPARGNAGALGAVASQANGVFTPGLQSGSVHNSSTGYQGDAAAGLGAKGVFVTPGAGESGAQPGGGTASPNTIKLQENYADSIKSGSQIKPETENRVVENLGAGGAAPLRSLLGLGGQ